jgi:type I restriction enzyme S subunit
MINGWITKTIKDVIFKTETIDPRKTPKELFYYIDVSSVSNRTLEIKNADEILGKDAPSRARRVISAGDVIFATVRPTLRRIAVVPDHLDGEVCSTGYFVFRTKPEVYNRYMFYFLQTDKFMGEMEKLQSGASYPAVNETQVKSQLISFPPLPEQKRIVAILDQVFAKIEQARAKAEKNLKNARELFESYLQQVFIQIGDQCEFKSIADESLLFMVDGDRGKNYPKKTDFLPCGHCLFLSTKNVRPDGFLFEEVIFVDERRDNLLRKGKLERSDVIITTRGTVGNLALYDDSVEYANIRINSGMLILRPNTEVILPCYLFEIMRSGIVKRQIDEKVSGAAQPQLPIKTLKSFTIPVPKLLATQKKVVEKIKSMEVSINDISEIYENKQKALDELKKSILQKAFSGELTNKDAEGAAA